MKKKKWVSTKEKIISFRITKDMNNRLEFQSFQMQIPTSDIIRKALDSFLPKKSDKDK